MSYKNITYLCQREKYLIEKKIKEGKNIKRIGEEQ